MRAFVRLFGLALLTLILFFLGVFLLRNFGLSRKYQSHIHPLLEYSYFVVQKVSSSGEQQIQPNLHNDKKNIHIPLVDLVISKDRIPFVSLNSAQKRYTKSGTFQKFDDFILAQKNRPFVLNIIERNIQNLAALNPHLEQESLVLSTILMSPFAKTLQRLKKDYPRFLYVAHQSHITRLLMFESLYLETFIDFWPDIVISPPEIYGQKVFGKRLTRELKRRHKLIFIDETQSISPALSESFVAFDGVLTYRPTFHIKNLRSKN